MSGYSWIYESSTGDCWELIYYQRMMEHFTGLLIPIKWSHIFTGTCAELRVKQFKALRVRRGVILVLKPYGLYHARLQIKWLFSFAVTKVNNWERLKSTTVLLEIDNYTSVNKCSFLSLSAFDISTQKVKASKAVTADSGQWFTLWKCFVIICLKRTCRY